MIARLTGLVVEHEDTRGIVDVHGVGYEVFAPVQALQDWMASAEPVTVHVSTQVREDAITLFGFPTALQRAAFQVLIAVSGIGPKMALAALNTLSVEELARATAQDDVMTLAKIPGVGKKKAQRLALELKGKLPVGFSPTHTPRAPARTSPADPLPLALARLDYGKTEIDRALAALLEEGLPPEAPLPERLRHAIRVLSGS